MKQITLILCVIPFLISLCGKTNDRPNILFVFTDDHRLVFSNRYFIGKLDNFVIFVQVAIAPHLTLKEGRITCLCHVDALCCLQDVMVFRDGQNQATSYYHDNLKNAA